MNAMRCGFDSSRDPATRLYLLLQAVTWTSGFIHTARKAGFLRETRITEIPGIEIPNSPEKAVEEIFDQQPLRAYDAEKGEFLTHYNGRREIMDEVSQKVFAFAKNHANHAPFLQTARLLTCLKSTNNAHDMKFPAGIFENYQLVSRQWRPHLLAASVHWLHGTRMQELRAVKQAREILMRS